MNDSDPLMRAAILLALSEAPELRLTVEDLERRTSELGALGENELRRRAAALRAQEQN